MDASTNSDVPAAPEPPENPVLVYDKHPRLARWIVAAAIILFVVMGGLILARWLFAPEATSLVQVQGDETFNNCVVSLMAENRPWSRSAALNAANHYGTSFHVPVGVYDLSLARAGKTVWRAKLPRMREGMGLYFDLATIKNASGGAATAPAAR